MLTIKVKLDENAIMPTKAHPEDAGYDIYSPESFEIKAGEEVFIDSGVHMEIPMGYVGMVKSKSGLNKNYGITCEGVIDTGYTGGIGIMMRRSASCKNKNTLRFERGDKLTQLVIMPIPITTLSLTDELRKSDRGEGGFGSTGR